MTRTVKGAIAGIVGLVVAIPIGTYVYIHVVEGKAPARLSVSKDVSAPTQGSLAGTWQAANGSQVGYRVKEVLFGQSNEAVGRTSNVTGTLVADGTTVTSTEVTVDLSSLASDQSRRDNQFRGRIMDTSSYPTATFTLTQPISLTDASSDGTPVTVRATGNLSLRGTTKPVTVDLQAKRSAANLEVNGTIPITFADWGIPSPSFGPVTTDDHGQIELLVVFQKAA